MDLTSEEMRRLSELTDRGLAKRREDLIGAIDRLTAENAALRATVERAWDEGYASGHNDGVCNADRHPNPYRAALAPEGAVSESDGPEL